jgi:hypothetical protein
MLSKLVGSNVEHLETSTPVKTGNTEAHLVTSKEEDAAAEKF